MNKDEYYISFRSYGTMVRATNTDDAIIVAKSNAIQKGYTRPKLVSVKFFDGFTNYYCRLCGLEQVKIKGSVCGKCQKELGFTGGKENNDLKPKPTVPQNNRKVSVKTTAKTAMTFEEFLKEYGGKWETTNSYFRFNSLKNYLAAEKKLEKMKKEGESHIMNVSFCDEFEKDHLNFEIKFTTPKGEIKIEKGKKWKEQNFYTMKEVFQFIRNVVHNYFQLITLPT